MTKSQRIKIARQVCENYKTGEYTLQSASKNAGISARAFHEWIEKGGKGIEKGGYKKIAELYQEAQKEKRDRYKRNLQHLTMTSLEKLLAGFYYEEKTVEFECGKKTKEIKKGKVTTKYVPPNSAVTIFMTKSMLGIKETNNDAGDQSESLAEIAAAMRDQVRQRPAPPVLPSYPQELETQQ